MNSQPILKIELSIRNKVLKTYAFTQDVVEIGRIPTADIFLDNTGISRSHTRIEKSIGGPYIVKDLGSTNGTYVNDELISEKSLRNKDVIALNKFQLRVSLEEEADIADSGRKVVPPDAFEGTTVLSTEQMDRMHLNPSNNDGGWRAERQSRGAGAQFFKKFQVLFLGGLVLLGIAIGILVF